MFRSQRIGSDALGFMLIGYGVVNMEIFARLHFKRMIFADQVVNEPRIVFLNHAAHMLFVAQGLPKRSIALKQRLV